VAAASTTPEDAAWAIPRCVLNIKVFLEFCLFTEREVVGEREVEGKE
jgi:hypothetical protein